MRRGCLHGCAAGARHATLRAIRDRELCDGDCDGYQLGLRLQRGLARHARAARRQGQRDRRDDARARAGSRAGRLHDHHRGVRRVHARERRPRRTGRGRRRCDRAVGGPRGPPARRQLRPAAGLRAQRRARLDAGDDGHGPQPRAQRRVRRRTGRDHRQPALRLGLLPPPGPDVRRRGLRRARRALRGRDRRDQGRARRAPRHRARRRRADRAHPPLPGALRLPAGSARAARARDPRRLRLLDGRPRRGVPADQRHPGRLGNGGQRPADGLREQRGALRLRRRLLA